jgi:hypothetical protein
VGRKFGIHGLGFWIVDLGSSGPSRHVGDEGECRVYDLGFWARAPLLNHHVVCRRLKSKTTPALWSPMPFLIENHACVGSRGLRGSLSILRFDLTLSVASEMVFRVWGLGIGMPALRCIICS